MTDISNPATGRSPTVYFIDDSATMREVIKISFRKENIRVIACPDAASALAQFGETAPDAVITDVIMPDKDGYEVCEFIKQHEQFAKTPVILMSGVVNRAVAERAMLVKADELIRKPFQPQDLIARVKKLLNCQSAAVIRCDDADTAASPVSRPNPDALRSMFAPGSFFSPNSASAISRSETSVAAIAQPTSMSRAWTRTPPPEKLPPAPSSEVQKLRNELRRLELLVKKLQTELDAQREYCAALEAHLKALQDMQ
jgi:DNA-binding response OmpR family regulator